MFVACVLRAAAVDVSVVPALNELHKSSSLCRRAAGTGGLRVSSTPLTVTNAREYGGEQRWCASNT